MKSLHNACSLVGFALLLTSCTIGNGRICGPQTPAAYCDREAYERLMHPKAYGEYWDKPDAAGGSASWRSDWVDCGGRPNGTYGTDIPEFSSNAVIFAADAKKRKELTACMTDRGYHFTGKRP